MFMFKEDVRDAIQKAYSKDDNVLHMARAEETVRKDVWKKVWDYFWIAVSYQSTTMCTPHVNIDYRWWHAALVRFSHKPITSIIIASI